MKQLTYIKKNTLKWLDVNKPVIQSANDVIARPLAAARCDGDKIFLFNNHTLLINLAVSLHYIDPITKNIFGKNPFKGPFPVGHECVAEIITCGENVSNFKSGDKVIVPWSISCGTCTHCLGKFTSKCLSAGDTTITGFGFGSSMGDLGGMICDFIRIPFADQTLVKLPENIDPKSVASLSDNIPDAWRTVAPQLRINPAAPVLVVGGSAESIGLYAVAIAKCMGSDQVDYIDYQNNRLDIAESVGANSIKIPKGNINKWYRLNAPKISGFYPISVDASANINGLNFAIRSLSHGGVCTSVGFYFNSKTSIPFMQMYYNNTSLITGMSHPRPDIPDILDLINKNQFKPGKITSLLADWENADQAFLERTTKVVVHRPSIFL